MSLSRRQLLRAAGTLSAGTLALPSWLSGRLARAEPGAAPRRIVFLCQDHGTVYDRWKMHPPDRPVVLDGRAPAGAATPDWEYPLGPLAESDFSTILRPLHPVRGKALVLDGLAMLTAMADRGGIPTHGYAMAHALTASSGRQLGGLDVYAEGPSVDQLIAAQVRRPDRFPSLELGTGLASPISFLGGYVAAFPTYDPARAYARLFERPSSDPVREALRSRRGAVVQAALAEYDRLLPALGAEDRRKLELHRDLLRDVGVRVDSVRAASCARPDEPAQAPPAQQLGVDGNYARVTDAMFHLVASALACDLTRVVTLHLSALPATVLGRSGDTHNDFAHNSEYASHPEATDFMTEYGAYYATRVRELAQLLDAIPEGDGTLLDHTVLVWMTEVSKGIHAYHRWPVVIMGGGKAGIRTGRYVRWQPRIPTTMPDPSLRRDDPRYVGPGHGHLLVALARAVGAELDHVGKRTVRSGSFDNQPSVELDLTGPIDRVLA